MKVGILFNPNYFNAFAKLSKAQLPVKAAWELKKIKKKMQEELAHAEAVKKDLVDQYAEKNEDGTVKLLNEQGNVSFTKENEIEVNKKFGELVNTDIEISFVKLSVDLFKDVSFSSEEVEMLEDFISFE
jgi:hypothetical protein